MNRRRSLIFTLSGEFHSPLFRLLANRPGLTATIQPTSVTEGTVTDLIRVRGPPSDLDAVHRLVGGDMHGSRITLLTPAGGDDVIFFQTCTRPEPPGVSLEHILLDTLGPQATFLAEFTAGHVRIRLTAPSSIPLEAGFDAYVRALSPRFRVELERLGPEGEPGDLPHLTVAQERLLLDALEQGYLDAHRVVGVRHLARAAGRGKSAYDEALRDATSALARHPSAASDPARDELVFEFWGGTPRSEHYAFFLASERVVARAEAIHVTRDRAWQVVVADGPSDDIDVLQAQNSKAPKSPIVRLDVLARTPERLVYYDEWTRPQAPGEGLSLEHMLFDCAGEDATSRTEFRHGACRVTCVGPRAALDAFWNEARPRLEARFEVDRVSGDSEPLSIPGCPGRRLFRLPQARRYRCSGAPLRRQREHGWR